MKLWIQEPFVNIPEDTIREALKVLLGMLKALYLVQSYLQFQLLILQVVTFGDL